jgi:hypothetical protein
MGEVNNDDAGAVNGLNSDDDAEETSTVPGSADEVEVEDVEIEIPDLRALLKVEELELK